MVRRRKIDTPGCGGLNGQQCTGPIQRAVNVSHCKHSEILPERASRCRKSFRVNIEKGECKMTFRTGVGCLRASATVVSGSSKFAAILRKLMPVARNWRTWSRRKIRFGLLECFPTRCASFDACTHPLHDNGALELGHGAQNLHREDSYWVLVVCIDALTRTDKPDTGRFKRTDAVE